MLIKRSIEILRDINQSSQRRSTFTETALKKLLEANLSAKYALTNQIGKIRFVIFKKFNFQLNFKYLSAY